MKERLAWRNELLTGTMVFEFFSPGLRADRPRGRRRPCSTIVGAAAAMSRYWKR